MSLWIPYQAQKVLREKRHYDKIYSIIYAQRKLASWIKMENNWDNKKLTTYWQLSFTRILGSNHGYGQLSTKLSLHKSLVTRQDYFGRDLNKRETRHLTP